LQFPEFSPQINLTEISHKVSVTAKSFPSPDDAASAIAAAAAADFAAR
jgi:hypothetical protein